MVNSNPPNQEVVGEQFIEDISKLLKIALGEGAAVCEACGEKLREGAAVVVFAFRPAEQSTFQVGHVKCTECRHEPTEYFTLGVRELVLDGRVGRCTDRATQSSWPVLLNPQPRAVSAANTTAVHPLLGVAWFRYPITRSDVFAAADRASTGKPWQRPVMRADSADRDSTPDPGSKGDDPVESSPRAREERPGGVR